jgi:hypothetical protein
MTPNFGAQGILRSVEVQQVAEKLWLQAARKIPRRGARKIDELRRTYSTLQRAIGHEPYGSFQQPAKWMVQTSRTQGFCSEVA